MSPAPEATSASPRPFPRGSRVPHAPMDVTTLIPACLLWPWRSGDGSAAATLHEAYARGVWRERTLAARAQLLVRILLWWPISTFAVIVACTIVNGAATRRRFGKPVWRQVAEQAGLAVRHSIPPPWYYIFSLWDDANRARAPLYLHRYETKAALYRLLRSHFRGSSAALNNKLKFHELCDEHGLPAPPLVMVLRDGAVAAETHELPAADLFVKPMKGRGGRGAERWECIAPGRYLGRGGVARSGAELVAQLAEQSREQPLLVQQRLRNHPELADVTAGALATARVMTVLNESQEPEVALAVFRTAIDPSSPVDNYHAGGLVSAIDLATGELSQASGGGGRGPLGIPRVSAMVRRCDVHPTTGAPIAGRRLPCWNETKELVTRAHAALPRLAVVGWDVAITPDGPVLVEGNSSPDVDLMQVGHQAPIGATRLATALAYHVRRAAS